MTRLPPISPGRILTGSLFNEPMRVETVQANGPASWVVGLVGRQSERFRKVTLTAADLERAIAEMRAAGRMGGKRITTLNLKVVSIDPEQNIIVLRGAVPGAPAKPETEAEQKARMQWWTEARFGMFIHWGLYALPARHEWVKSRERLTDEAYARYFDRFDPDLYEPREWARAARMAGMNKRRDISQ